MSNTQLEIQRLFEANPLREPVLRAVVQALRLPAGSSGLDVGCGIGLQALLLADAVGSNGRITGLDINPELLAFGTGLVERAGLAERVTFRQGSMFQLPFPGGAFDWVWSADCVGYPAGDLPALLNELVRVVKPGGSINLLAWTSQQVLPGYPLLEARLNANCSSYTPYLQGRAPQQHFMRALEHFRAAGLVDLKAQTFAGSVQAPLTPGERAALCSLFDMLWSAPQAADEDWQEFQRLCRPESAGCILDEPGYCAFFTYTLFSGCLPPSNPVSKG